VQLGAVILAAGAATRMGSIKQLLPYGGQTLVENAITQAQRAEFSPVVVVLGAKADEVGLAVARTSAQTVLNQNWESGMGSSIKAGLERVLALTPDVDGLAILLADQPLVVADQLRKMAQALETGTSAIVAASYAGTSGVPAIFRRSVFARLQQLPDEAGARALLRGGADVGHEVGHYVLPEGAIDIDTPADYAAL
jgi:molybdenum cofactor cytidylyltransferase